VARKRKKEKEEKSAPYSALHSIVLEKYEVRDADVKVLREFLKRHTFASFLLNELFERIDAEFTKDEAILLEPTEDGLPAIFVRTSMMEAEALSRLTNAIDSYLLDEVEPFVTRLQFNVDFRK